jgi:hypothetical protein
MELDTVFLLKSINATAGIQELLLASEERVAVGANFDAQLLFNRTSFESVATCAGYLSNVVLWLNCFLHLNFTSLALSLMRTQSYIDT